MYINDEDKVQYNLIEDKEENKIIGRVGDIIEFLENMIEYNLNNTDDEDSILEIRKVLKDINADKQLDEDNIIALCENCMQELDFNYVNYM